MAKSRLYQCWVLHHAIPTKAEEEQGKRAETKIIVAPKTILAPNDDIAKIAAAREIPDEYVNRLDEVEVGVQAF